MLRPRRILLTASLSGLSLGALMFALAAPLPLAVIVPAAWLTEFVKVDETSGC
jgi:hypothetical protein